MKNLNKRKNKTNDRGFTLIEVMIGLTIFTIGILGVMSMHLTSMQGDDSSRGFTEATNIALDQMENMMLTPYANLTSQATTTIGEGYRVSWTISENTSWEVKTVNMTIEWTDAKQTRSLNFNHMIPLIN